MIVVLCKCKQCGSFFAGPKGFDQCRECDMKGMFSDEKK